MCAAGVLACVVASLSVSGQGDLERFEYSGIEMAVPVRMVLYAPDEAAGKRASTAAFGRIRELNAVLSDYDPTSEVRRLSASSGSGEGVSVSSDLWHVLRAASELSVASDGAFDVTVGPVVRLWRRARRRQELPPADQLEKYLASVGHEHVQFMKEERRVLLNQPDMWIDLGGIAKGYAVDAALEVLKQHGISSALVDAGGDIGLGDAPPGRPAWVIAVAPLHTEDEPTVFLSLSNVAVATSGDSWQFVEIEGRRYSHLIDPRTGIGLTDHSSVTVVAPDAMTADGLASAVSVLGPQRGIELIERTEGASAYVLRAVDGREETYSSKCWADLPRATPAR